MLDLNHELQILENIQDLTALDARYQATLGKKGSLTEALKSLATMTPEEKKEK